VHGEVVAGLIVVLARLQQRLARDAADIGAGAPGRRAAGGVAPVVDAGGTEAELGGADRGDVAAGALRQSSMQAVPRPSWAARIAAM